MDTSVKVGILFILLLIGLGIYQGANSTTLAGAVTMNSQQEINLCMNDCMRSCVQKEGDEPICTASCDKACL